MQEPIEEPSKIIYNIKRWKKACINDYKKSGGFLE